MQLVASLETNLCLGSRALSFFYALLSTLLILLVRSEQIDEYRTRVSNYASTNAILFGSGNWNTHAVESDDPNDPSCTTHPARKVT